MKNIMKSDAIFIVYMQHALLLNSCKSLDLLPLAKDLWLENYEILFVKDPTIDNIFVTDPNINNIFETYCLNLKDSPGIFQV